MEFTKGQKKAIALALKWWLDDNDQVFKIAGLAGCGKSTIVFELIRLLKIDLKDCLFTVYTGKGTLPLRQNGLDARTIHSTCYNRDTDYVLDEFGKPFIVPTTGRYKKSSKFVLKDKLPKNIKLIVVDESSMVNKAMSDDLKSFGIKIIALGDPGQLEPIFGKSELLNNPDIFLTEIVRQAALDPIVFLADLARRGKDIPLGKYGPKCFVVDESILKNPSIYLKPDMILCGKNKTRGKINDIIRHDIKRINSDLPVTGDKMVCRKNNWDLCIDEIPLINGLFGYVINVHNESFNGKSFNIDFMPECTIGKWFEDVEVDYNFLNKPIGDKMNMMYAVGNCFEYGHASTVHLAQGSQYGYVLGIEEIMGSEQYQKKFMYTMITRAVHTLVLVRKKKPTRQFFF